MIIARSICKVLFLHNSVTVILHEFATYKQLWFATRCVVKNLFIQILDTKYCKELVARTRAGQRGDGGDWFSSSQNLQLISLLFIKLKLILATSQITICFWTITNFKPFVLNWQSVHAIKITKTIFCFKNIFKYELAFPEAFLES